MQVKSRKVLLCGGAGGTQGGAIATRLLQSGYAVTTIARSREKCAQLKARGIEARPGDLGDLESLRLAGDGAEYIAFVLPLERDRNKLALYTDNVIAVARAINARNLVFNTSSRIPELENRVPGFAEKSMVDAQLRDSGIPFICLRPTIYMENIAAPWSVQDINERACVKYPIAADKPIRWNSVDDIAAWVVAALDKTQLAGRVFEIGGPEAVTGRDIAVQFSQALGRDIHYEGITPAQFAAGLVPFLGETQAMGLVSYYEFINAHPQNWAEVSEDLSVLGYQARDTFKTWAGRLHPGVFG